MLKSHIGFEYTQTQNGIERQHFQQPGYEIKRNIIAEKTVSLKIHETLTYNHLSSLNQSPNIAHKQLLKNSGPNNEPLGIPHYAFSDMIPKISQTNQYKYESNKDLSCQNNELFSRAGNYAHSSAVNLNQQNSVQDQGRFTSEKLEGYAIYGCPNRENVAERCSYVEYTSGMDHLGYARGNGDARIVKRLECTPDQKNTKDTISSSRNEGVPYNLSHLGSSSKHDASDGSAPRSNVMSSPSSNNSCIVSSTDALHHLRSFEEPGGLRNDIAGATTKTGWNSKTGKIFNYCNFFSVNNLTSLLVLILLGSYFHCVII